MLAMLKQLWVFLLLSGLLGAAVTGLIGPGRNSLGSRPATRATAAAVLALATIVATSGLLPGRAALWLELALAVALAYAAGGMVGSLVRDRVRRSRHPQPEGEVPAPVPPAASDQEAVAAPPAAP